MITIDNKEWFDSFGNTYFSADVHLGNDLIMSMPMQYGYSEHCRQVFEMAFCKHFNIDYQNAPGWAVREALGKNGIKISVSTRDVKKRDLYKGEAFQDFTPFLKPENLAKYAFYRMQNNIGVKCNGRGFLIESIVMPDKIVSKSYTPTEKCRFKDVNWF